MRTARLVKSISFSIIAAAMLLLLAAALAGGIAAGISGRYAILVSLTGVLVILVAKKHCRG